MRLIERYGVIASVIISSMVAIVLYIALRPLETLTRYILVALTWCVLFVALMLVCKWMDYNQRRRICPLSFSQEKEHKQELGLDGEEQA
jgi:hypothetical protein